MNFDMYSNKQYNDDLDASYIYPRPYIDRSYDVCKLQWYANESKYNGRIYDLYEPFYV